MDEAMRGPVARALGEALEARFEGRSAIIRIERLRLHWAVPADLAAGGDLAGALGRRLAEQIGAALTEGTGPGLRLWPDAAAQAADFVLDRLGLRPTPAWAFPDFAALSVLTGPEAAAEVLAAGGPFVLRRLSRSGISADRVAMHLGDGAAARVMATMAKAGRVTERALVEGARGLRLDDLPLAAGQHLLRALMERLAEGSDDHRPDTEGADVRALARASLALEALARRRASGEGLDRIRSVPRRPNPTGALSSDTVGEALSEVAEDPVLWSRAALLTAPAATVRAATAAGPGSADRTDAGEVLGGPETRPLSIHSAYAGLAPLLALCPCPDAPREALRTLALLLLPEGQHDLAAREAGFCALFPADPNRAPLPLADPNTALWRGQGTLAGADRRDGLGAWADLWLARFAARLQGLHGSSRGYLRREFLCRPGRIERTDPDAPLQVRLPSFPLAIVMRMSGLVGLTPPIPHLGQRLLIDLER